MECKKCHGSGWVRDPLDNSGCIPGREIRCPKCNSGYIPLKVPDCIEEVEELRKKVKRLESGLVLIMSCAGAPDPDEALREVIMIARNALGKD
jgi:hypothetical protein